MNFTKHAEEMLMLRRISKNLVEECIASPDKILSGKNGLKVYLKDFGKNYLKLVVAEELNLKTIVTLHWLDKKRIKGL